MQIKLPPGYKFPDKVYVGFSGGADSSALLHFLTRCWSREVIIAHFNHGTPGAGKYEELATDTATRLGLDIVLGRFEGDLAAGRSIEHQWAIARHEFFSSLSAPVAIAHHLDDAVETWLDSCLRGVPHVTQWTTRNCIRPMLLTPKSNIYEYCRENHIEWIEDPTNYEPVARRNVIRHKLVPQALEVNPGLRTVVSKLLLDQWKSL